MALRDYCNCALCTASELERKRRLDDATRIFKVGRDGSETGWEGAALGRALPSIDDEIKQAEARLENLKKLQKLRKLKEEIRRLQETDSLDVGLPPRKVTY